VPEPLPTDIRELTAAQAEVMSDLVAGLSDAELIFPTRCAGWLAAHLLVHVRLGLAEATGSFAEPTDEPADRDYVSYWRDWPAPAEPPTFGQVRWHWANASAYGNAGMFRDHFTGTARQAAGVSRHAPTGRFSLQGHVMAAEDILAMWTVELVVHQFDLIAYLPGSRPGPLPEALSLTARTLDGLVGGAVGGAAGGAVGGPVGGAERPGGWDDATYVLKGTGRVPLDAADREFLGDRAAAFPALG
jgi:Mycothiol maleylpyruvate isomerase N-terminal domain